MKDSCLGLLKTQLYLLISLMPPIKLKSYILDLAVGKKKKVGTTLDYTYIRMTLMHNIIYSVASCFRPMISLKIILYPSSFKNI